VRNRLVRRSGCAAGRSALVLLSVALLGPAVVHAAPSQVPVAAFPSVQQWYNLSCEYAAAAAVTLYWGPVVSQRTFLQEVPANPNPHEGFRGDINGPIGGLQDYGVYAEPLVPVLARHGYQEIPFYRDPARLKAELRAGHPVVVWITTGQGPRPIYTASYLGASFRLVPHEHAVVAYGYDGDGIDLMDVGNGRYYHTAWASFLRRWGYFDDMALLITLA